MATTDLLGGFQPAMILGALEIGTLISAFLFGLLTLQTYIYYRKFEHDTQVIRALVRVNYRWVALY